MSKILWINPIGNNSFDEPIEEALEEIKQPQNEIEVVSLEKGPKHLEYRYYEALVLADILHIIKKAEKDGFDAAVIGCFYDLALQDARSIVDNMIVTAPCEAGGHIAATLGHKFSVIVTERLCIPQMMDNIVSYGLKDKLASFKSLDLGVLELHADEQETTRRMKQLAKEAVEKDGAEVIVLGCTIQFGFYKELQEYLNVPVIDAIVAPFKYAEFLAELKDKFGWSHSKIGGYTSPMISEIKEWGLQDDYKIKGLWD
ncbi:MAG TPA: hydantoin racemase [Thermoanaerobacterales bacterium]|jgi:allantoin racemase|nr:hydantoin racemase [Thermoanaerobacterales bacterium]